MTRCPRGERAWESHLGSLGCHVLQRSAGPEGRGVQHFGRRTGVTTEKLVRYPCRRPTHWEISNRQKHEAGALTDVAKGLRMGGRDDQATSLGQGNDADESGKPGH